MSQVLVQSELNANVWQIAVALGDMVSEDQDLLILESMKMEIPVPAPCAGRVTEIRVKKDDAVRERQVLVVIET